MAGLQQYNFFPTDLLYPRPQPSSNPSVLPLQTPKPQTSSDLHLQNQPSNFINVPPSSSSALVYSPKGISPLEVDKKAKLSQPSTDPLSLLIWVAEEEDSDSF